MKISVKTDGFARSWMKSGPIFMLDAWKNCRDRLDAPAFPEGFREIAGSDSSSRTREIRDVEMFLKLRSPVSVERSVN